MTDAPAPAPVEPGLSLNYSSFEARERIEHLEAKVRALTEWHPIETLPKPEKRIDEDEDPYFLLPDLGSFLAKDSAGNEYILSYAEGEVPHEFEIWNGSEFVPFELEEGVSLVAWRPDSGITGETAHKLDEQAIRIFELEACVRELEEQKKQLEAHHLEVAQVVGIVYQPEGHAEVAGPDDTVIGEIRRLKGDANASLDVSLAKSERLRVAAASGVYYWGQDIAARTPSEHRDSTLEVMLRWSRWSLRRARKVGCLRSDIGARIRRLTAAWADAIEAGRLL